MEVHLALWEGFGTLASQVDQLGFLLIKQLSLSLEHAINHVDKGTNRNCHNDEYKEDRSQESCLGVGKVHAEQRLLIASAVNSGVIGASVNC